MQLTDEHQKILEKLQGKGILILQGHDRMSAGYDLKAGGLVNGKKASFLGKPCFVLYGFTDSGFDHILSNHGRANAVGESLLEAPEQMT